MNGDLNNIIEVVNEVFEVDIRARNRSRRYIDAKKVYFHIGTKLLFSQAEIGIQVGVDRTLVVHHSKSFEYILMGDPILRRNLEACWSKVNSILGLKNFNYKDVVMLNWKHLTNNQRKKLSELSEKYFYANKVSKEVYV